MVNYKNGFISEWKTFNVEDFKYGSPKKAKNARGFLSHEAKQNVFAD